MTQVLKGDCREQLKLLKEASVDAVVTDPPYGLSKEPDIAEVLKHWLAGDDYVHKASGFMGKKWDSFVPGPSYWNEIFRVMKPGAYLAAFSGTRTYDMMVIAIRMAGFEIRDQLSWMFGSGFPKSLNVSKAILKTGGNDAKPWQGYGTALKPSQEPIVLARKPLIGTVAANVLEHGTGALNIDGCRVVGVPRTTHAVGNIQGTHPAPMDWGNIQGTHPAPMDWGKDTRYQTPGASGRWPANVLLTHHHDCDLQGTKRVKGTSVPASKPNTAIRRSGIHQDAKGHQTVGREQPVTGHADDDGKETVEDWDCVESCPIRLLDEPPGDYAHTGNTYGRAKSGGGQTYGTSQGGASRFFYCAKTAKKERQKGCEALYWTKDGTPTSEEDWNQLPESERRQGNIHITVKPVALMRWLTRLVTPPGGTVLDPFMGSGSTGVAATEEGFDFIGIEMEESSHSIALARLSAAGIGIESNPPVVAEPPPSVEPLAEALRRKQARKKPSAPSPSVLKPPHGVWFTS